MHVHIFEIRVDVYECVFQYKSLTHVLQLDPRRYSSSYYIKGKKNLEMQFYLVLIFFDLMTYWIKCHFIYLYTLRHGDDCLDEISDADTHLFDFQV